MKSGIVIALLQALLFKSTQIGHAQGLLDADRVLMDNIRELLSKEPVAKKCSLFLTNRVGQCLDEDISDWFGRISKGLILLEANLLNGSSTGLSPGLQIQYAAHGLCSDSNAIRGDGCAC